MEVALTEKDYAIYTMFYDWDTITIREAYIARAGRLPDYVLKPLMHFYEIKSKLKAAGLDMQTRKRSLIPCMGAASPG